MSAGPYQVAIVGGGLVGASLACALGQLGVRTALVEAVTPKADQQPSYDDRTLVLSHTSCQILKGLNLWPRIATDLTPVKTILVSELGRPGRVELNAEAHDLDAFGQVVEARHFGHGALGLLSELEAVDVLCPAKVSGLTQHEGHASLTIDGLIIDTGQGSRQIDARLVVAADGARSTVRELLGVQPVIHDYRQTAVIANVTPEIFHDYRAFERLTPTGPLAILPHIGQRCGLVWTAPSDEAEDLQNADEQDFLRGLQRRFGYRLGNFRKLGARSRYPLYRVEAKEQVSGRVVIIGNAAHTIHPISAQGFNLGLRDVAVLAELLARPGVDPGDAQQLDAYRQRRAQDQQNTIRYTDSLVRLFANPSLIVQKLRTLGLAAHELLPPLKRRLALSAMGYRGPVSRLAQGESITDIAG